MGRDWLQVLARTQKEGAEDEGVRAVRGRHERNGLPAEVRSHGACRGAQHACRRAQRRGECLDASETRSRNAVSFALTAAQRLQRHHAQRLDVHG